MFFCEMARVVYLVGRNDQLPVISRLKATRKIMPEDYTILSGAVAFKAGYAFGIWRIGDGLSLDSRQAV